MVVDSLLAGRLARPRNAIRVRAHDRDRFFACCNSKLDRTVANSEHALARAGVVWIAGPTRRPLRHASKLCERAGRDDAQARRVIGVARSSTAVAGRNLILVGREGCQDFVLLALGDLEHVQRSSEFRCDLIEFCGRDFERAVRFLQTQRGSAGPRGFELEWSARNIDRKSTRLNSSHVALSRMPSSA